MQTSFLRGANCESSTRKEIGSHLIGHTVISIGLIAIPEDRQKPLLLLGNRCLQLAALLPCLPNELEFYIRPKHISSFMLKAFGDAQITIVHS